MLLSAASAILLAKVEHLAPTTSRRAQKEPGSLWCYTFGLTKYAYIYIYICCTKFLPSNLFCSLLSKDLGWWSICIITCLIYFCNDDFPDKWKQISTCFIVKIPYMWCPCSIHACGRHAGYMVIHSMCSFINLVIVQDMAAHSACDFGGGKAEKLALAKYRQVLWQGRVLNSQFTDEELRNQGRCPLTPEEIGLLLAALGFDNSTRLYLASHKVFYVSTSV